MTDQDLQKEMAQIFRARRRERYIKRYIKRYIIGPLGAVILLLASLKIVDLVPSRSSGTVDISFSLECRRLEGDLYKTLFASVADYERPFAYYAQQYQQGDLKAWDKFRDYQKLTNVAEYDIGDQLAFVHGMPDGGSDAVTGDLRVVKATLELILLEGSEENKWGVHQWDGYIDRRTGHAEITQYISEFDTHKQFDKYVKEIRKQYKFECEPSKPAKS
jgi:hypothetical protein